MCCVMVGFLRRPQQYFYCGLSLFIAEIDKQELDSMYPINKKINNDTTVKEFASVHDRIQAAGYE